MAVLGLLQLLQEQTFFCNFHQYFGLAHELVTTICTDWVSDEYTNKVNHNSVMIGADNHQ